MGVAVPLADMGRGSTKDGDAPREGIDAFSKKEDENTIDMQNLISFRKTSLSPLSLRNGENKNNTY